MGVGTGTPPEMLVSVAGVPPDDEQATAKIAVPIIISLFAEKSFMADPSALMPALNRQDSHSIIGRSNGCSMRRSDALYGENRRPEGAQSKGGWGCRESAFKRSGLRRVGFPRPVTAQVAKTMMAISIGGMKRIA